MRLNFLSIQIYGIGTYSSRQGAPTLALLNLPNLLALAPSAYQDVRTSALSSGMAAPEFGVDIPIVNTVSTLFTRTFAQLQVFYNETYASLRALFGEDNAEQIAAMQEALNVLQSIDYDFERGSTADVAAAATASAADGMLGGVLTLTTNALGYLFRISAGLKNILTGDEARLPPGSTDLLQLLDSGADLMDQGKHIGVSILKYNPITQVAIGGYHMGEALLEGNTKRLIKEAIDTASNFIGMGSRRMTPLEKRNVQLQTKQLAFAVETVKKGIIEENPLRVAARRLELANEAGPVLSRDAAAMQAYVIEQIQSVNGSTLPDVRRVSTVEDFAKANQGGLEMTPAGEARPATNGCFVAGTLVHTREGLVPIEKIKVGDWVLSQPEEQGERAYKRVAKTFSFDDKQVVSVDIGGKGCVRTVVATGNHPFFVKDVGWTRADELPMGAALELHDGVPCHVFNVSPVYRTETPDVGWIHGGFGNIDGGGSGRLIDMRNGQVVVDYDYEKQVRNDAVERDETGLLSTRVYNLEIEDFHTYYVGDLGVWVHNTNCAILGVSRRLELANEAGPVLGRDAAAMQAYVIEQIQSTNGSAIPDVRRVSTVEVFLRVNQGGLEIIPAGEARPGTNGCFVAGTLVHTREGLVPIEKIKVGDWVLSQPEEQGERAYKRVAKTFSFDDKQVVAVDFATKDGIGTLVATGNHPFFVKDTGWTRADHVQLGAVLELHDGVRCEVFHVGPVCRTETPDVGWIDGGYGKIDCDGFGRLIDMRGGKVLVDYDHRKQVRNDAFEINERGWLSTRVYNLEVEDFHTYYVGDLGVWVHNTNCGGMGVSLVTPGEVNGNSAIADVRRVSTVEDFARVNQGSLEITPAGEARPGTNGCFMAGTLVHTREGLVPIEKIKVGDWVLSQPEDQGERAYKRVVKTFSFDDKEIVLVRFHKVGPGEDSMKIEQVAVTGNHPFWLEGQGWTRADLFKNGDYVELHDGTRARVICSEKVYATQEAGVGWAMSAWGIELHDGSGNLVDLRDGAVAVELDESYNWEALDNPDGSAFRAKVFNFEVEDFRTYYVGAMGAWVHNTNCANWGVTFAGPSVNLRPNPNSWVYVAGSTESKNIPGPHQG